MDTVSDQDQHEFIGRVLAVMRESTRYGNKPFGCSEIAERLKLPKNTAWRILKGLAYHRFLQETSDGQFFRPR
jgi:DNA-binding IclR family transcriptional regulator